MSLVESQQRKKNIFDIWPLKEAVAGKVRHTDVPNRFRPVSEYLEPQRRFQHLF